MSARKADGFDRGSFPAAAGEKVGRIAIECNYPLEVFVPSHAKQDFREAHVVLDDQNRSVTGLDCLVIVFHDVLSRSAIGRG